MIVVLPVPLYFMLAVIGPALDKELRAAVAFDGWVLG